MYRSKRFIKWTELQEPVLHGSGDIVAHHVKMLGGGGMAIKPPDTHVLPIAQSEHHKLDSPGHSERSVFADHHYMPRNVIIAVRENIETYLCEDQKVDVDRLVITLLTNFMDENNL